MKDKIYVWDPLVRVFHWVLVLAFITSYISGENEWGIHQYSGYLIIGLITFRVLWGFVGSKHARFADFVRPVPETIDYLKGLFSRGGEEKHFVGHNPAGGLMVIALLLSLFFTGFSGLKLYGAEGHGPFAVVHEQGAGQNADVAKTGYAGEYEDDDEHEAYEKHEEHESDDHDEAYEDEEAEEFWEEIHEFFVHFTLILIILHVAGVILSSRKYKENLVKAMITGYKEKL